jgi:putative intracellular protease/amidase
MIIGIPAYEGVDLLDMTGPYEMFHWAGFDIDVLAASPGLKTSGSGFSFLAHKGFAEDGPTTRSGCPVANPPLSPKLLTIRRAPISIS